MNKVTLEMLCELFPFKNISHKSCEQILSEIKCEPISFKKGEIIFDKDSYHKRIGFILSGECDVEKERSNASAIPLNRLHKNSSFGILSVFQPNSEYPTRIIAKSDTKILFIEADIMISLIKKYPTVAMNVIKFLTEKIVFLNKKITSFSASTVEIKVANYLYGKYITEGEIIHTNISGISKELDIGRASLYRILSAFEAAGYIKTEMKKIYFINPQGLERIIK